MSILDIANEMIRETKSHLNDCIRNSMFTTIDLTISSLLENSTITFELINTTSIPTTEIIKSSSNQTSLSIIIRIIAYTIIFIAALIGNISVLITLIFTRRLRTVTNAFLTNLAISDLLLGIFCMPFTLAGSISRNFMFGPLMCKLIPYFQAISVGVCAWTLVAISFERYFAICHPLESRRWQTVSHSYRVIAIIWLTNIFFMSPIAFLSKLLPTKTTGKFKCREVWPSEMSEELFNLSLLFLLLIIPFIIMVTTYSFVSKRLYGTNLFLNRNDNEIVSINNFSGNANNYSQRSTAPSSDGNAIDLRKQENSFNGTSMAVTYDCRSGHINGINETVSISNSRLIVDSNGINQMTRNKKMRLGNSRRISTQLISKKRIIRMLCVLVLEFFICWTPIYVINVWSLYAPKQVYSTLGPTSISFIHLLSYLSSCTNPITYCFMHRKFREALIMMIRNRRTNPNYVMSELNASISNHSPSTTGTNSNPSNNNSTNTHNYRNLSDNKSKPKRTLNYLTPKTKIRNVMV